MKQFPGEFKPYVEPIIGTADIDIILSLIDLKIIDSKTCISTLKSTAKSEKRKRISVILGKIGGVKDKDLITSVDDSLWGQISLGALGYIGDMGNYGFLVGLIR